MGAMNGGQSIMAVEMRLSLQAHDDTITWKRASFRHFNAVRRRLTFLPDNNDHMLPFGLISCSLISCISFSGYRVYIKGRAHDIYKLSLSFTQASFISFCNLSHWSVIYCTWSTWCDIYISCTQLCRHIYIFHNASWYQCIELLFYYFLFIAHACRHLTAFWCKEH